MKPALAEFRPPGRRRTDNYFAVGSRLFMLGFMKSWVCAFAIFFGCTGIISLRAVQTERLSIEELGVKSALVVRGTVLSKSCQRDPDGRIYTKVELQIADVWKGSLTTNRIAIVHGGGILGGQKTSVSGQVEYGIGEEVVAFLVFNQRAQSVTLGLAQGKFHVRRDAGTGEFLVHNLFHGEAESRDQTVARSDRLSTQRRLTLTELKRQVRGGSP